MNNLKEYLDTFTENLREILLASKPMIQLGNQSSQIGASPSADSASSDSSHDEGNINIPIDYTADDVAYVLIAESYEEILFLGEMFSTIKGKFLAALDHLKFHPSVASSDGEEVSPSTSGNRQKRSILSGLWEVVKSVFGGGGSHSSNYDQATIDKIKENLEILQRDINKQEEIFSYSKNAIDLTRVEMGTNREAIHTLDAKMIVLNYTISTELQYLKQVQRKMLTLASIQHRLNTMRMALFRLQLNVQDIYDYLVSISTNVVTPVSIPPKDLRRVLKSVMSDMEKFSTKIKLPYDPKDGIWEYYKILRIYPIVLENQLVMMIDIPLVDRSRIINIYRVHNLPILHPKLRKMFQYQLESNYVGITQDTVHITLLDEIDIIKCIVAGQNYCRLKSALFPTEKMTWCVYAHFINDPSKIQQHCKIDLLNQTTSLAISLPNNIWVLGVHAPDKLRVSCLSKTEIYYINVEPPFQIIELPDSCEAYSSNILIPAYANSLKSKFDLHKRFLGFQKSYVNITDFRLIRESRISNMTEAELDRLSLRLPPIKDLPVLELDNLEQIDTDYPYSVPTWLIVLITILVTIVLIVVIGGYAYYRYKRGHCPISQAIPKDHGLYPTSATTGSSVTTNVQQVRDSEDRVEMTYEPIELSPPATTSSSKETPALKATSTPPTPKEIPTKKATPENLKMILQGQGFDFTKYDKKIKKLAEAEDTTV